MKGGGINILKRGGKLGQGVGALKKGQDWNSLMNHPYAVFKLKHQISSFIQFK